MSAHRHTAFAVGLLALAGIGAPDLSAAQVTFQGSIVDANQRPIPGLAVSVANQARGRSRSAYTDASGHYVLSDIPVSSQPYAFEVYWGQRLAHTRRVGASAPGSVQVDVQLR